jgi:outer membrane autotransporter protein
MRKLKQYYCHPILIPTALSMAVCMFSGLAQAQQRSEYVISLVDQLHQLQQNHPEVIASNLQKVKDTMASASATRRQEAIWDNSRYNASDMTDSARGGLPDQFYREMSRIGGEYSNPFMNMGENSPGQLHDVGKSLSGFRRPCSAEIGGVTALVGCSSSNSFPSGHTSKGTGANLLAAYLFPERYQQFVTRAQQYGESRLIVGVHYPLDVMAARAMTYKAVADLLAEQVDDPNSWLNVTADPTGMRTRVLAACNGLSMQACANNSSATGKTEFDDYERNKSFYNYTKYYGFEAIGATDQAMVVPDNAEYLIKSRYPYLSTAQLREIIRTTADPSGQVLDDPWSRINLFAAADGYGRFDSDTTVTMDAALAEDQSQPGAGYHAADTWRNSISGSGMLTKAGSGVLTLMGNNSFGGLNLEAGSIKFTGDSLLSGNITASGGTLVVGNGGSSALRSSKDVTIGTGAELRLNEGRLGASGNLNISANTHLDGSGAIEIAAGKTGSISGDIDGQGSLYKYGTGNLTLSGNNSYSGGTRVAAGTLTVAQSNAAGSGDISLQDGTVLSYADGVALDNRLILEGTVALNVDSGEAKQLGDISGSGNYTLTGNGHLDILSDMSNFDGTTNISGTSVTLDKGLGGQVKISNAGTLVANGNATANVEVGQGGTLKGKGSIGSLSVKNGGSVGPGNSPGTLNVNGDVSFEHGSSYQFEVDPVTGEADRIAATGHATINGGSVTHIGADGRYKLSSSYIILTAAGGVTGQFDQVSSNFAYLTPTLSYDSNSVSLTLERNAIGLADITTTSNQASTATAIGNLSRSNTLHDAVLQLSESDARSAFEQLSGELQASTLSALAEDASLIRNVASNRINNANNGATSDDAETLLVDKSSQADGQVWISSIGNWTKLKASPGIAALNHDSQGTLIGFDQALNQWRTGAFAGYSHSEVELAQNLGNSKIDNYHVGLYSGTRQKGFSFGTGMSFSWHEINSKREVRFTGFSDNLRSNYNAYTLQAYADLGYGFNVLGHTSIEPFLNVAQLRVNSSAHTEQGGAAALDSAADDFSASLATSGIRAAGNLSIASKPLRWHTQLGWRSQLNHDNRPSISQRFVGSNTSFKIAGAEMSGDALVAQAGLELELSSSTHFGLAYIGQKSSALTDQSASLTLQWRF